MVLRSLLLWVEQEDQEMRKIDQGELFIYLSEVEYFQLTASVCNLWMDEDKSEYPRLEDEYSDYIIDSQPDD